MTAITKIDFQDWVDNCLRDYLKRGGNKEDATIVLLDKTRELIINGIMDRQGVQFSILWATQ